MKLSKHIVILTPGFAENEADENCIPPIQLFIKTYNKVYPETTFSIISFQYPFNKREYKWFNTDVYSARGKNKRGLWKIITWGKVLTFLLKIRSKNKNLVLHCLWLTECHFIGLLFSKLFSTKVVSTLMGQDAKKSNKYLKFLKFFKSDIICCSKYTANLLRYNHSIVCSNIIPFGSYEEEYSLDDNNSKRDIDVIGVGNLGPIKRFDLFIKLIAEIKKQLPAIKCEIIGDGENKKMLENQIKALGLEETILLKGELNRSETLINMRRSKILLHTSDYEGQGYVYMEALASGAYVVSFDVGFLPLNSKVQICRNDSEVINKIVVLLKNELNFNPISLMSMKQTVDGYQKYYTS